MSADEDEGEAAPPGADRPGPSATLRVPMGEAEPDGETPEVVALPINGTLDLHQFRPEEVAELVPEYLEECLLRGLQDVRIIHGRGKGTLRRTVHAALERCDLVASYGLEEPRSGGWGATWVRIRPR